MGIGGLTDGVTVKDMVSAYQIFGNGGQYYEPYTYYYVLDHDGNRILDNTNKVPQQAISSANATIMQKLLREPIYVSGGTGNRAQISGWSVYGKTGTTDNDCDAWFIGGTTYAVAGVWAGYKVSSHLPSTRDPITLWKEVMTRCLENHSDISHDFTCDPSVSAAT